MDGYIGLEDCVSIGAHLDKGWITTLAGLLILRCFFVDQISLYSRTMSSCDNDSHDPKFRKPVPFILSISALFFCYLLLLMGYSMVYLNDGDDVGRESHQLYYKRRRRDFAVSAKVYCIYEEMLGEVTGLQGSAHISRTRY